MPGKSEDHHNAVENHRCVCSKRGWCERHKVRKTQRERDICSGEADVDSVYRKSFLRAWYECEFPSQQCHKMPPLSEQATNLTSAAISTVAGLVKGESPTVSEEEQERRLRICRDCKYYDGSRCSQCGCLMSFKASLRAGACPISKW